MGSYKLERDKRVEILSNGTIKNLKEVMTINTELLINSSRMNAIIV